jgi:hypothetical protein
MNYAILENGVCANTIVADADFAATIGAIELPDGYGIGDTCNNGVWTKAPQPVATLTDEQKKAIRDGMVRDTMATYYPDITDEIGILYRGTADQKATHESNYQAACTAADAYIATL